MKTIYLTVLSILYISTANAYTSLRVQDPQRIWNSFPGKIDTAVLSIKPRGAYFECGLYLTMSNAQSYSDTTEIQMYFDLPEGAIIEDSWLWVGNQIVQADIRDRRSATMIYEGIVQRRQDPSILFKNSNTEYELRVFPLPPNQKRKVKITYLLPAEWGKTTASIPLPLNILKTSANVPPLRILSYTDNVWTSPSLQELPSSVFQAVNGFDYTQTLIPSSSVLSLSEINYVMPSPMENGVFAARYATSASQGYYQLVVNPSEVLNIQPSRKTALLFDYEPGNSTTTRTEVLSKTKQLLLSTYTATDSFNMLFAGLQITKASEVWLPCDSATIEATFTAMSNAISNVTNIPSLLSAGVQFVKSNGANGEIVLISNSDNYGIPASANQLVESVIALMAPDKFKIHVLDFTNQSNQYYNNGQYYYGNRYFNLNIANTTGGNFEAVYEYNNNYYYYYDFRPFNEVANELFFSFEGKVTGLNVDADFENGFTYSNYSNIAAGSAYLSKPIVQVGKYYGDIPAQIEVSGMYSSSPVNGQVQLANFYDADIFTRKIWIGNWLYEIENSVNPDNQTIVEAIDSSIHNRVLSRHTAFLALEPSDTVKACDNCVDETNPNNPSVGIYDLPLDSVSLVAFPNPFVTEVTINITLANATTTPVLKIYNVMGQVVKQFEISDTDAEFTLSWNGNDNSGQAVSAGIYILTLETETGKKTIKLLKQ